MNKIYVRLYVPLVEQNYEIFIPTNQKIYGIIILLVKAIRELVDSDYELTTETGLYCKESGCKYDPDLKVIDAEIKNGIELILV